MLGKITTITSHSLKLTLRGQDRDTCTCSRHRCFTGTQAAPLGCCFQCAEQTKQQGSDASVQRLRSCSINVLTLTSGTIREKCLRMNGYVENPVLKNRSTIMPKTLLGYCMMKSPPHLSHAGLCAKIYIVRLG